MLVNYLLGSVVVGLLQITESVVLYKHRGRVTNLALNLSACEFVWAGITAWVLTKLWTDPSAPRWHMLLYLSYVVVMLVWSARWMVKIAPNIGSDIDPDEKLEALDRPWVTPSMVFACALFGASYALISLILLLR